MGFPTTKHRLCPGLVVWGVPTSHLHLINLFTEFHHPYRFYMLHDDIPHILLYILIWLIFRFPTVQYANQNMGERGVSFWDHCSVFFLIYPVTLTLEFDPIFENVNLANNFWTMSASALIFHISDPSYRPWFLTLWPWPWS